MAFQLNQSCLYKHSYFKIHVYHAYNIWIFFFLLEFSILEPDSKNTKYVQLCMYENAYRYPKNVILV